MAGSKFLTEFMLSKIHSFLDFSMKAEELNAWFEQTNKKYVPELRSLIYQILQKCKVLMLLSWKQMRNRVLIPVNTFEVGSNEPQKMEATKTTSPSQISFPLSQEVIERIVLK